MANQDRDDVVKAFKKAVNLPPARLERWLEGDRSREVGQKAGGQGEGARRGAGESVGHHMGGEIVRLKRTKKADLTDDDVAAMRKVVGYVDRHLAQRPQGDVTDTTWRASLMNWGHDPLRD